MFRAPMPEAAVDKNGDLRSRKKDVYLAPKFLLRAPMNAKTKSVRVERTPKSQLAFGVAARLRTHPPAHLRRHGHQLRHAAV